MDAGLSFLFWPALVFHCIDHLELSLCATTPIPVFFYYCKVGGIRIKEKMVYLSCEMKMSNETPEFRLKSWEPTVVREQLPQDIHSLASPVCPNSGSFTLLRWAWLQGYVIVSETKWNYTDFKEKSHSRRHKNSLWYTSCHSLQLSHKSCDTP